MKNKKANDRGDINVVHLETMEKLGFKLDSIYVSDGDRYAKWVFNCGGPMAVHNLEVDLNITWQVDFKTAVSQIYHAGWGVGWDKRLTEIKRVLELNE